MEESFSFLFVGLLYVMLGAPLFFQRVKRNGFYGYRVEKSLSADKYWYPVNKSSGKWFIIGGFLIFVSALILSGFELEKSVYAMIMVGMVVFVTLPPIVIPYFLLKKIR